MSISSSSVKASHVQGCRHWRLRNGCIVTVRVLWRRRLRWVYRTKYHPASPSPRANPVDKLHGQVNNSLPTGPTGALAVWHVRVRRGSPWKIIIITTCWKPVSHESDPELMLIHLRTHHARSLSEFQDLGGQLKDEKTTKRRPFRVWDLNHFSLNRV